MRQGLFCVDNKLRAISAAVMAISLGLLASHGAGAQTLSYSSGQNVSPGYEGWEVDPDGSRWFVFGYMNRNWQEEPTAPIGPENNIEPGVPDQGQPTRFQPRRNRFVFRVPVPEHFEVEDELVWTLTVNGVTERAHATLRPDYLMDAMIRASEHGALGAGFSDERIRSNIGPTLAVEGKTQRTVRVGEPLTLVAVSTDDGNPESLQKRFQRLFLEAEAAQAAAVDEAADGADGADAAEAARAAAAQRARTDRRWLPQTRGTVNQENGHRVSWFVYHGEGDVAFAPPQVKVWEDTRTGALSPWAPNFTMPAPPEANRWTTQVVFSQPGTYVLRCRASDGAVDVDHDVVVTVSQ